MTFTEKKRKNIRFAIGAILLCMLPFLTLGISDALILMKWQLYMIMFLVTSIPLAKILFHNCEYLLPFAKTFGFIVPGFMMWVAGVVFQIPFSRLMCGCMILVYVILNIAAAKIQKMSPADWCFSLESCIKYEVMFFLVFLFWVYLIGFNPAAYGTEKFMDYAFLQKMLTSTKLPPDDMWFAGKNINYYYGGQYYAAFIAKVVGGLPGKAEYAYNMMRAMIPASMFVGVFGIVEQAIQDKTKKNGKKEKGFALLSAVVAVFAGNGHYIIYGLLKPFFDISGDMYWFPDATRYIGYTPLVKDDQTIHEFPCYSFILGDLHAHMINIIIVTMIIALLYSFSRFNTEGPFATKRRTAIMHIQLCGLGLLWGICNFTNYWDYIIYLVVISITIIFSNVFCKWTCSSNNVWAVRLYRHKFVVSVMQILLVVIIGKAAALPFTMNFESVFNGVGIAHNHSKVYQLAVLWGIPFATTIPFIVKCIFMHLHRTSPALSKHRRPDMFIFILACCAIGLVLIPEFVYVRDIYEATHARANTMFKLTYQAFIMFSICSGYILYIFTEKKENIKARVLGFALLGLYVLTFFYFFNAADSWFAPLSQARAGIYALNYLDTDEFKDDKAAILWLKEKAEKNSDEKDVIAEAPGASYTACERVSTITGLSTPAGWLVHEWLWRDSYEDIHSRQEDIDSLYLEDKNTAETIIEKYDIGYIFFGTCEAEKYGESTKENIKKLGKVIYEDEGACIVEVR